jgi:hypothetical protein
MAGLSRTASWSTWQTADMRPARLIANEVPLILILPPSKRSWKKFITVVAAVTSLSRVDGPGQRNIFSTVPTIPDRQLKQATTQLLV